MTESVAETLIKQQTPKLEAQFPSGVPPASLHSEAVRQRPLVEGSVSKFVVHSSFGKDTRENRENASESRIKQRLDTLHQSKRFLSQILTLK